MDGSLPVRAIAEFSKWLRGERHPRAQSIA
jgi:hypothetical protein